ncbi:MAG: glycosyltransferase family 4 protein [Endomicrobiia bacterium]
MKIGIDCRELKGKITGIGRFLIEFLKKARAYKEFEFVLFGNQYTNFQNEVFSEYKKIVIPGKITFFWDQFKLKNVLEKNNLDLFFSPYYKVPIFSDIPLINSLFDVIYLMVKPYRNQLKNRIHIKNFIKIASKKVKKTLTCSNSTKNDLIEHLSLPEEKIEVVYLSVDERFVPQTTQKIFEIKNKYGIYKKYILYVGNFSPHKNVKNLIEAYKILQKEIRQDYTLVLIGDRRTVVAKFIEPDKSDNYIVIENVPDDDLAALYSGAELFVFPSLYEGFGLPPLEAMACGCPVISSNTSSMPEILGDACLYFNPYDVEEIKGKIKIVLEKHSLRNELIQKGFERVKNYSTEKMVKKLLEVFNLCVKD